MNAADAEVFEASLADADDVASLAVRTYVDAFGAGFSPEDLEAHIRTRLSPDRWREFIARDHVLVVRIGNQLAGFTQFGDGDNAGEVEIFRLYVERNMQGQGLGSRLLNAALGHPDSLSASAVWVGVWEDNIGARRLYERFGFTAEGRRAFVLPSGDVSGYDTMLVRRSRKLGDGVLTP